jgi:DNA ligase-1
MQEYLNYMNVMNGGVQTVGKFTKLYAISANGKTKVWEVESFEDSYSTTHGYLDGKLQTKDRPVKGKNMGRANETSPTEQASKEAQAKWNKQYDKGYRETIEQAVEAQATNVKAMKCKGYHENSHKIKYPCTVQPKLNGIKALVHIDNEGTVSYTSNGGKEYTTLHHLDTNIRNSLKPGIIYDGEIYLHGTPLEDISSAVKKVNELTPKLEYWVYDYISDELADVRMDSLFTMVFENLVKWCHTYPVASEKQYDTLHNNLVLKGFEGTIIRNDHGDYRKGYRSYDVLKRKDFKHEEFEIVGAEKDVYERVVWICVTEEGKEFKCVPMGDDEQRKSRYIDRNQFIGEYLMVKYLEKSKAGIPQGNPVGECIRDYE